jgi:glyoxylase-like metal-dependent hydrolase (beta-lactamase superfamily II)
MQVSPSVRAVQVPDENPMHPMFTNIYLVGSGQVLAVDSGEAMDRYKWMLRGYLAATERAEIALAGITHHHADHSGNLKWARSELKAEIVVHKSAVPLLKGKLPKDGVRTIGDGESIDLGGGVRPRVIPGPGHSVDSICYYLEDEGVLFTGDTLLGSSTTTVNDLGPYRRTLKLLLELPNLKVICPGHGALVHDPRERLKGLLAHREMRERQILDVLAAGAPVTSWEIMLKLYPDIDKRLRRAADGNVRTHLRQLEQEGRLLVHAGKARRPNAARVARDLEHAKARTSVIKKGKRFEAAQQRSLLRGQENPPNAEWSVPPKFELVGGAKE